MSNAVMGQKARFHVPGFAKRTTRGLLIAAIAAGFATAAYQTWVQLYPELAVQCGYGEMNLIEKLVDWLGVAVHVHGHRLLHQQGNRSPA